MKKKLAEIIGDLFARRQYNQIIRNVYWGKPKTILDVGGSSGTLARKIKRRLGKVNYNILEMKEESIKKGKKRNPFINFIQGNAEDMPFKKNEFDLAICKDVLHHCENPKKAIKEIKRIAKDYIIIEARRGDKWLDYYLPGHHHFTADQFKELVKPNKIYFLHLLWPRLKLMPFFLMLPVMPKSKNSFMVGTSYNLPPRRR